MSDRKSLDQAGRAIRRASRLIATGRNHSWVQPDRGYNGDSNASYAQSDNHHGRELGGNGFRQSVVRVLTTIAIIGAGPLGRWLALAAVRAGHRVLLEDVMPSNLHHASEYIRQEIAEQSASLVEYVATVEDAVREADLVIDCVPDELESKLEILWLIDRMAPPRTVLATPTTQLSIADLASCTYRADQCVAMAVDPRGMASVPGSDIRLATTPRTSQQAVDLVCAFWESVGFHALVELEPES